MSEIQRDSAAARAGLTASQGNLKCRRGDVIGWGDMRSYTGSDGRTGMPVALFLIGIVTKVNRDGLALKADTGFGAPQAVCHDVAAAGVAGDRIDMDKARAWLASSANYPRAGSVALRSMGDVRAIVRTWLKVTP